MKALKVSIVVLSLILILCCNASSQTKLVMDLTKTNIPVLPGDQGNRSVYSVGGDSQIWLKVYLLNVANLVGYQVKFSFDKTKLKWKNFCYTEVEPYTDENNPLTVVNEVRNLSSDTTTFELARSRGQNGNAINVDTMWIATIKFVTNFEYLEDSTKISWQRGQLELKGQEDLVEISKENMENGGINCEPEIYVPASEGTVTDVDGNIYKTVKIGDQWWMAENLNVTRYQNGEAIPKVTDNIEWVNLSTGAYCICNDSATIAATYGNLYNWYSVNDNRNIAPVGWRVPTDADWKELEKYLGMSQSDADDTGHHRGNSENIGGKLKEVGTTHWNYPNMGADNSSGFSALPGGIRGYSFDIDYINMGNSAHFWSSTEDFTDFAWFRELNYSYSGVLRGTTDERCGLSVRCVREATATSIKNNENEGIPSGYKLHQNYPNPFNPETKIRFSLKKPGDVSLKVYNTLGQEVAELINRNMEVGSHSVSLDASKFASGVYFYVLKVNEFKAVRKMILLK